MDLTANAVKWTVNLDIKEVHQVADLSALSVPSAHKHALATIRNVLTLVLEPVAKMHVVKSLIIVQFARAKKGTLEILLQGVNQFHVSL